LQLTGGSQRQLGQGTIVFHVKHNGTETQVEYGVRAAIKIVGLQSTFLHVVPPRPSGGFQKVRHGEVAREAREGRPTYCPAAHPAGESKVLATRVAG